MTIVHRLGAKAAPEPTAISMGSAAVAGGGFTRLNPVDGLFLRAEHLALMQQYTSKLAAAVGAGLGSGVAYGYTCSFSDAFTIEVNGGLAFADGQPLHSTETASISVENLTATELDFWIIEIVSKTWQFGSEPVYGGLCEDPCGKGSGIRPKEAVGVEVRLRRDSLDKPAETTKLRRNRLASYYFERERKYGGEFEPSSNAPWLMPVAPGGQVLDIRARPWSKGTGPHDYAAVPLGVVWQEGSKWHLDTWIARRDLGEPTPAAAWQWRLGWRPRNVFLAQVVQFQAQLADSPYCAAGGGLTPETREMTAKLEYASAGLKIAAAALELQRDTDTAALVESLTHTAARVESLVPVWEEIAVFNSAEPAWLSAAGFGELPPAGYLPFARGTQKDMEVRARRVFGPNVQVQVRVVRADFVAHAVEQVQHMDRIPLDAPTGVQPKIDLLVPDIGAVDLPATRPGPDYGWAAFVRRREESVPPREDVHVYSVQVEGVKEILDQVDSTHFSRAELEEIIGKAKPYGAISYPAAEWGVPVDTRGDGTSVWQELHHVLNADQEFVLVIGVAYTEDRQPLAALRSCLLVIPQNEEATPVEVPPVFVGVVPEDWPTELIIAIIGSRDRQGEHTIQRLLAGK